MSASGPTRDFWQQRFQSGSTPWDRGEPNPALEQALAAGLLPAGKQVLVPGCGVGREAARLAASGFRVTAVDYAPAAVAVTRDRLARDGLAAQVVEADLLAWTPAERPDVIWDQACLCALHPDLWVSYANRLAQWLEPGGLLFLLAIQAEREGRREGRIEGPPYHCDVNAIRALFPASAWEWPKPPYGSHAHPSGFRELQIYLRRASGG